MIGEIWHERFNTFTQFTVLNQIVETLAALKILQSIDHGVATVITNDDDHFVTGKDAAVDVAIHHHIAAVANKHDQFTVVIILGFGHRGAPAAARFIAHATKAIFAIIASVTFAQPSFVHFTGQSAGSGKNSIFGPGKGVHGPNHFTIARYIVCWLSPFG